MNGTVVPEDRPTPHRKNKERNMKKWALFLAMLLSITFLLVPITQAAEETAGRAVYHTLKMETMEVGDVPGHIIGVVQQAGLGFFTKGPASGQIATRMNTVHFDAVKGKGTFTTYVVYSFRDGSTVVHKAIGTIIQVEGGTTATFEGTYEVTGGTGKFAGAKGKGTFKGESLGPSKTGMDSYTDFTGTQ
jgi:hypothetical protein